MAEALRVEARVRRTASGRAPYGVSTALRRLAESLDTSDRTRWQDAWYWQWDMTAQAWRATRGDMPDDPAVLVRPMHFRPYRHAWIDLDGTVHDRDVQAHADASDASFRPGDRVKLATPGEGQDHLVGTVRPNRYVTVSWDGHTHRVNYLPGQLEHTDIPHP